MRNSAVIVLLVLTAAGCQFDPYAHRYTTVKPTPRDVAGTYRLTEQTITPDGPAALGGKPCVVELHEDGTFLARNVPPPPVDETSRNFFSRLVSTEGRWHIDRVGSIDDGNRPLKTHWGLRLDAGPAATPVRPVGLIGNRSPYGLIFTIGDPDGGHVLILEKTH
jgi:hypothetical protein